MAPEQLEGKPLDARADIFAFGAVLHEMITGRPAFDAGSSAGIIAAILNSAPPPPSSQQPLTPQALDRLVMTCLAKAREDRWQSTVDLLRELRWIGGRGGDGAGPAQATGVASRSPVRLIALIAAALVVGALLGGSLMHWRGPRAVPAQTQVLRFPITMASNEPLAPVDGQSAGASLDLSPDGSKLAYIVVHNGRTQLMLRSFDRLEPIALPGTEGASAPFFSPDGEWIGFFAGEKLKRSRRPAARRRSWAPCRPSRGARVGHRAARSTWRRRLRTRSSRCLIRADHSCR